MTGELGRIAEEDTSTGEVPEIPEDTLSLGERLDPVRTLLRRTARGDVDARGGLIDALSARVYGLALHVTGSARRAERITVAVLRSCVQDAQQLADSGLPGEAAALDRARRTAVPLAGNGAVRSLASQDLAMPDRTRDRREVDVVRVLISLPATDRALLEAAAQGRAQALEPDRMAAAARLASILDQIVTLGDDQQPLVSLAALDALALADQDERTALRSLTSQPHTAAVHRHAIEAAARLTLLTARAPEGDISEAVLSGLATVDEDTLPPSPSQPTQLAQPPRPHGAASDAPATPMTPPMHGNGGSPSPASLSSPSQEAAYHGTYATPVLGTSSQQRVVGPPVRSNVLADAPASSSSPLESMTVPDATESTEQAPPAFSFRPADERSHRRRRRRVGRGSSWVTWVSAISAVVLAVALVAASLAWIGERGSAQQARAFADTWAQLSVEPDARAVVGTSDNGTWRAVMTPEAFALSATGVEGYRDEVLQLWAVDDATTTDLGVIRPAPDGSIRVSAQQQADRLLITRENAPRNESGTPSERIVAAIDPAQADADS